MHPNIVWGRFNEDHELMWLGNGKTTLSYGSIFLLSSKRVFLERVVFGILNGTQ